jgi:hypothetical protein
MTGVLRGIVVLCFGLAAAQAGEAVLGAGAWSLSTFRSGIRSTLPASDAITGRAPITLSFPGEAYAQRDMPALPARATAIIVRETIPAGLPRPVRQTLCLSDKDGLWFQAAPQSTVIEGDSCIVTFAIDPASAVYPVAHFGAWDAYQMQGMVKLGLKLESDEGFTGTLTVESVSVVTAASDWLRPSIRNLAFADEHPRTFAELSLSFALEGCDDCNPFDRDELDIEVMWKSEAGEARTVAAFFSQDYVRRSGDGPSSLSPLGRSGWCSRYTPFTPGVHEWRIRITKRGQVTETAPHAITVAAGEPRGFVGVSRANGKYFESIDGSFFLPIGQNIHAAHDLRGKQMTGVDTAPPADGLAVYEDYFRKMSANGENSVVIWMCNWWVSLEWSRAWKGYRGLGHYNLENAWKMDRLFELAERHGIHIVLAIDNHGMYSQFIDQEWGDSPYSAQNGGPCRTAEDFFTDPAAFAAYQNKLRYIYSRWGAKRNLLAVLLISEVTFVGRSWKFHRSEAFHQWFDKTVAYIHQLDSYGRPVAIQYASDHRFVDDHIARHPSLDIVCANAYRDGAGICDLLISGDEQMGHLGKPYLCIEFGGTSTGSTAPRLGADLHSGLWTNALVGASSLPFLWWTDFIDHFDRYHEFRAIAAYMQGEDLRIPFTWKRMEVSGADGNPDRSLAALVRGTGRKALNAWIYDRVRAEIMPLYSDSPSHRGAALRFAAEDLEPGLYRIEWWSTRDGKVMEHHTRRLDGDGLELPIPQFTSDIALKIRRIDG